MQSLRTLSYQNQRPYRGARAGPAGTAVAGPMLEAKLMNLIKGPVAEVLTQHVKFTRSCASVASPDQS